MVCITILSLFLEIVTEFFVLSRFIGHQQDYIKNYLKIV